MGRLPATETMGAGLRVSAGVHRPGQAGEGSLVVQAPRFSAVVGAARRVRGAGPRSRHRRVPAPGPPATSAGRRAGGRGWRDRAARGGTRCRGRPRRPAAGRGEGRRRPRTERCRPGPWSAPQAVVPLRERAPETSERRRSWWPRRRVRRSTAPGRRGAPAGARRGTRDHRGGGRGRSTRRRPRTGGRSDGTDPGTTRVTDPYLERTDRPSPSVGANGPDDRHVGAIREPVPRPSGTGRTVRRRCCRRARAPRCRGRRCRGTRRSGTRRWDCAGGSNARCAGCRCGCCSRRTARRRPRSRGCPR